MQHVENNDDLALITWLEVGVSPNGMWDHPYAETS